MSKLLVCRPLYSGRSNLRARIAREAANLLYLGVEKEYKQAKQKAAEVFGGHFLPTNLEIALELDRISEEHEGQARKERLVKMRGEALKLMEILGNSHPVLAGSVWRGTVNHESDIDIIVYDDAPTHVLETIEQGESKVLHAEWVTTTEHGQGKRSFHIQLESPTEEKVEIVVRNPEEAKRREKCDVYGDKITGLCLQELRKLLRESPTQRFLPS
jgi:predicted nucleotidyltransferase